MITFLRWLFSNSGALSGTPSAQAQMVYLAAKRPLVPRECPYCKCRYWAFTKSNEYCGKFRCYRQVLNRRRKREEK